MKIRSQVLVFCTTAITLAGCSQNQNQIPTAGSQSTSNVQSQPASNRQPPSDSNVLAGKTFDGGLDRKIVFTSNDRLRITNLHGEKEVDGTYIIEQRPVGRFVLIKYDINGTTTAEYYLAERTEKLQLTLMKKTGSSGEDGIAQRLNAL